MEAGRRRGAAEPPKAQQGPVAGKIEPDGKTPFDKQGWHDMFFDRGFAAAAGPVAAMLAFYLLRRIYRSNAEGRWSIPAEEIEDATGLSERSIRRAVRKLEALGVIAVRARYRKGIGRVANEYRLIFPPETLFDGDAAGGGIPATDAGAPVTRGRSPGQQGPGPRSPGAGVTHPIPPPHNPDSNPHPPTPHQSQQQRLARIAVRLDAMGWRNATPAAYRRDLLMHDVALTLDAWAEFERRLATGGPVSCRAALFDSIFQRLREQRYGGPV